MGRTIALVTGSSGFIGRHLVAQLIDCGTESRLSERQPLPNFKWSGLVIEASDDELHRSKSDRKPTWAAQVNMENPRTLNAITAALRPRHPAVTRRKIMIR